MIEWELHEYQTTGKLFCLRPPCPKYLTPVLKLQLEVNLCHQSCNQVLPDIFGGQQSPHVNLDTSGEGTLALFESRKANCNRTSGQPNSTLIFMWTNWELTILLCSTLIQRYSSETHSSWFELTVRAVPKLEIIWHPYHFQILGFLHLLPKSFPPQRGVHLIFVHLLALEKDCLLDKKIAALRKIWEKDCRLEESLPAAAVEGYYWLTDSCSGQSTPWAIYPHLSRWRCKNQKKCLIWTLYYYYISPEG